MEDLGKKFKEAEGHIIEMRRWFHQHPELSLKEKETSEKIKEELDKMGIPHEDLKPNYGVVATIQGKDSGKAIVRLSDPSLYLDAVKRAEDGDGYVIRVHECRGGAHEVQLTSDYGIKRFAPCNLLEEKTGETTEGGTISFGIKPFEIRSYRVWF